MTDDRRRATLRSLTIIVFLQWMGATLGLPLLPLFLKHRGGTPTVIGLVMSSFFVAGLLTQFLIGHLADRFGRRRVLVVGLAAYGIAASSFLLPLAAPWFTLSRAIQGAGAGAIEVASLSAVASLFGEAERGRALGRIYAAQLMGIAVGPVAGSVVPLHELGWAFCGSGVLSVLASIRALRADLDRGVRINEPLPQVRRTPQLYGALAAAASIGLCVGVYESCWSLLMRRYGASTLEIRLSWTFFSIPWVLLSPVGGWLADHGNRKWIAFFGTLNAALFLALYPQIHNVLILLALGPLESIGGALSVPSTSSLLSQGATVREMGRRQGLSTSANTAALAASAAAAGTLFSVDPVLPFVVMASISGSVTLTLLWFWRHVQGRVTPEPTSSELAAPS